MPHATTKSVKVKSLSHVRLFVTPWTIAYQAPLSMGFSRQKYWSGVPLPSLGDLAGYIIISLCLETVHLIFKIGSSFTLLILWDLDTLITIGSHKARHLTSPIRSSHLRIWNLIRGAILEIGCESSPWQSHRPDSQPLMGKGPGWGTVALVFPWPVTFGFFGLGNLYWQMILCLHYSNWWLFFQSKSF